MQMFASVCILSGSLMSRMLLQSRAVPHGLCFSSSRASVVPNVDTGWCHVSTESAPELPGGLWEGWCARWLISLPWGAVGTGLGPRSSSDPDPQTCAEGEEGVPLSIQPCEAFLMFPRTGQNGSGRPQPLAVLPLRLGLSSCCRGSLSPPCPPQGPLLPCSK